MRDGWVKEPLSNIAEIVMGQSPPSSTYNNEGVGLPFFQGKAEFGDIYPIVAHYCSKPQRTADKDDILMTVRAPVGPVNLSPAKCCIGRGLSAIRARGNAVDQMYLFYFLRSIESTLSGLGQGSTFGAIGRKDIQKIMIPYPKDVEAQSRIVDVLRRTHQLKQNRERAIQLSTMFSQSIFLKMFGDPDINSFGWETNELGDLATCLDHKRIPVKESDREIGDTPYYGANGQVGWIKGYIFEEPLLLLAEDGGNWNKFQKSSYRVEGKSWVNNHAHVLRENGKARLEFLEACLNLSNLSKYISGTTRGKLTRGMMNKIRIPTPPPDLQSKFVAVVKRIETLQKRQIESATEINDLFQSLTYRAFNGELSIKETPKVESPNAI